MSPRGLLWLGLLAAPAWALPPVSLSVGYSAQVVSTRSFDFVAEQDHLQQLRGGVGYAFGVGPGLLDLELAFAMGSTSAQARGVLATLVVKGVEADLGYRLPWRRFFHPFVRVALGWDWASLTVVSDARLGQTVSNVAGTALLGAQIPFKLGPRDSRAPTLLFDLALGYTLRPAAGFHSVGPAPSRLGPEDLLPHGRTDLGSMPLSGISYRILTTFRF